MSSPYQKTLDEMNFVLLGALFTIPCGSTVIGVREELTPKMNSLYQKTRKEMTYRMVFLQYLELYRNTPQKGAPGAPKFTFCVAPLLKLCLTYILIPLHTKFHVL